MSLTRKQALEVLDTYTRYKIRAVSFPGFHPVPDEKNKAKELEKEIIRLMIRGSRT